jgi:hypothetical protein
MAIAAMIEVQPANRALHEEEAHDRIDHETAPTAAKASASQIANRSGRTLCTAIPVTASSIMRRSEYLVLPRWRRLWRNGTLPSG